MTNSNSLGRREFLRSGTAFGSAIALGLLGQSKAMAAPVKMPIGVGTHTMAGPLILKMQQDRMIETAASQLGFEISADYQDFQALLRMLQAVAAGQLQYGMLGSTPNIRLLASSEPAVPIAIAGGGLDFPLQVPADSSIRNMEDLKGKTVLTLVGSDLHLAFNNMVKAYFGTDDINSLGIKLKNISGVTELFERQSGIDAYVGFEPASSGAAERGILKTLLHNNGTTGPHYDGPEGQGEGHELAWFKNADYYPDGFYPHRIWWVVRRQFLKKHPEAVTAFLAANQRAAVVLKNTSEEAIVDLIGDHWKGSSAAKRMVVEQTLWCRRGWIWVTEGDAETLVGLSKIKSIFEKELTGNQVRNIVGEGAEVARRAYELVNEQPPEAVFTDPNAKDVRGLPPWEYRRWKI